MQQEHLTKCILCGLENIPLVDTNNLLCRCESCGLVFDNPRPTTQAIVDYYSLPKKYDNWLQSEKPRQLMWQRRVRKLKKYLGEREMSVLDIGAGTGQFLHALKGLDVELYGTEVSQSGVEIAKEKYGIDLFKGELENINFGDKKFNLITLFHVLEHVPYPMETIEQCSLVLKKNGIIIVAVPNELVCVKFITKSLLRSLGVKKFNRGQKYFIPKIALDGSVDEIHLSHFTPTSLKFLFSKAGFEVLELSADPYSAYSGGRMYFELVYYFCVTILNLFLRSNYYETTWVVARKLEQ